MQGDEQVSEEIYEEKFKKIKFISEDLLERYKKIIVRNNGSAIEYLPTYRTIIKYYLHEQVNEIKTWINKKYSFKNEIPLGTYIDNKMFLLEDILTNEYSNQKKQTKLKSILTNICDAIDLVKEPAYSS
jgi:hypothetical protein